jgi:ribosomal protein L37AE/L43A
MKIWNVGYSVMVDIRKLESNGELEGDEYDQELVNLDLQIGALDFFDASIIAEEILDNRFGEDNYDITGCSEMSDVNIVNWPGEEESCNCPFCRAERMNIEDVMIFNCPKCDKEIKIAPNGWDNIRCIECKEEISFSSIVGLGGNKYKVLKLAENKKED